MQLLGNIQDAAVSAGGTSRVYLLGNVSGATTTALSGLASLFVQGGPDHKLTGSAEGLSRAIYIGGSCDIGDQVGAGGGMLLCCCAAGMAPPGRQLPVLLAPEATLTCCCPAPALPLPAGAHAAVPLAAANQQPVWCQVQHWQCR